MTRKILVNALISFGLLQLFFFIKYYSIEIDRGYWQMYSFEEKLKDFLHSFGYMIPSFLFSILILWPNQLIKDDFYRRMKPLSFLKKWLLMTILILVWIVLWGCFSNIWAIYWLDNYIYLAFSIGFALVSAFILHYLLDFHIEKNME